LHRIQALGPQGQRSGAAAGGFGVQAQDQAVQFRIVPGCGGDLNELHEPTVMVHPQHHMLGLRRRAGPGRVAGRPRTRGDGPFGIAPVMVGVLSAPHTRGWSRRYRHLVLEAGVGPVYAEMVLKACALADMPPADY
jgi:hypothetical protein